MGLKLKRKIIRSYFPLLWPRRSDFATGSGWWRWWTWRGRPILCKTHDFWRKCWGWQKATSNYYDYIYFCSKEKKIKNISKVYFSLCHRKIMDLMCIVLQQEDTEFRPVVVTRSVLQTLSRSEVYILKRPKPLRYQFFRSLLPDVTITQCPKCNKVIVIAIIT